MTRQCPSSPLGVNLPGPLRLTYVQDHCFGMCLCHIHMAGFRMRTGLYQLSHRGIHTRTLACL